MKNIHLLRTNLSRLYYSISMSGYNLKLSAIPYHQSSEIRPQHLYITSDEEIKPNTYCLINGVLCKTEIREGKIVSRQLTGGGTMDICKSEYLEIILTTDDRLIADGVQAIDDEFLEWFVKNPSCEEVETFIFGFDDSIISHSKKYEIIIPKVEHKQEVNYYSSNLFTEKKEAIEFADYLLGNFEMAEFEKEHPKYVVDDELCWQLAGTQQKYTTVEMYQIWLNESTKTK